MKKCHGTIILYIYLLIKTGKKTIQISKFTLVLLIKTGKKTKTDIQKFTLVLLIKNGKKNQDRYQHLHLSCIQYHTPVL